MNDKITIVDDFIDSIEFEVLQDLMCGPNMDWYPIKCVNRDGDGYFQLTHRLFEHGPRGRWQDIVPVVQNIPKLLVLMHVKANLLTRTENHDLHGFHTDILNAQGLPHKTGIFYCNTTNGWTEFETGKKVECVANRMVMFDGQIKHSSVSQTDEPYRVVINFNWFEEKPDEVKDRLTQPGTGWCGPACG